MCSGKLLESAQTSATKMFTVTGGWGGGSMPLQQAVRISSGGNAVIYSNSVEGSLESRCSNNQKVK